MNDGSNKDNESRIYNEDEVAYGLSDDDTGQFNNYPTDHVNPAADNNIWHDNNNQTENNKMFRRQKIFTAIAAISLAINLFLAGIVGYLVFSGEDGASQSSDQHYTENKSSGDSASGKLVSSGSTSNVKEVVNNASPAVVKIETIIKTTSSNNPFFDNDFFRQYFGVPEEQESVETGMGSGFIISDDGYILTNEHVVNGASEINVTITGYDKTLSAKHIGSDADLDLAVLKVEAGTDLPFLSLGDSESIDVGDWAIAIGNPYGLDHTTTLGVISAKERAVTVDNRAFENLLQTDASINPGNSGGPLLDISGDVIGINNAVSTQAQGIGFAIPINTAKEVLDQLINEGKVIKPWIGIEMQNVTQEVAQYFNVNAGEGVLVASVIADSPAESAGLQKYDIIMEINGQKINNPEEISELVSGSKIGDSLKLLLYRNGQTTSVTVITEEKP